MLSPEWSRERFFSDTLAILSNWEAIILRIELYLIFKKWVASLIFFACIHTLVCIGILLDLGKYRLIPTIEKMIDRFTGFDVANEIHLALLNKEIYSVQELSYYAAKGFRLFVSTINIFNPYRRKYPVVSLVIGITMGVFLIWLGSIGRQGQLAYTLLNFVLVLPGLQHHKVFSRVREKIQPYIDRLEAEFDRGQFETSSEREAGEKEHWEPMASSPFFTGAESSFFPTRQGDTDADELDISEAQFIQRFIPERVQRSTWKNRKALSVLTRDIMMTSRNQDDIDDWFSEANGLPLVRHPKRQQPQGPTGGGEDASQPPSATSPATNTNNSRGGDNTTNGEINSSAWDEFSTDEEEEDVDDGASNDDEESILVDPFVAD